MSKLQSMPLFPADFFADTAHMDTTAAKAYLYLLMHAWLREAKLPNDDMVLARLAGVSRKVWPHIKQAILALWALGDDGYWRQKRLSKEYDYVCRRVEGNRKNGSAGGRAKAAKKDNKNNESVVAVATEMPRQPTLTPTLKD